jgi:hypothetical protein
MNKKAGLKNRVIPILLVLVIGIVLTSAFVISVNQTDENITSEPENRRTYYRRTTRN